MVHEVIKEEWYTPKWNDNLDAAIEDQISVRIVVPTGISSGYAATDAMKDDGSIELLIWDFCRFCVEVKNLQLNIDGAVRDATPRDIATVPGLGDLFVEIRGHYLSTYGVDKKKLLSDSTSGLKGSQSSQKKTTKTQPEL